MKDIDGFDYPVDIYAPNGIPTLNVNGETIIEVKHTLTYSSLKNTEFIFQTHKYNLLVVYFKKTISVTDDKCKDGRFLKFIDYKSLHNRSKKESAESFYFDKQKKWKENRDNLIDEACKVVKHGNNVLFLGAGVSASANMPSWEKLLQSLMGEVSILKQ